MVIREVDADVGPGVAVVVGGRGGVATCGGGREEVDGANGDVANKIVVEEEEELLPRFTDNVSWRFGLMITVRSLCCGEEVRRLL